MLIVIIIPICGFLFLGKNISKFLFLSLGFYILGVYIESSSLNSLFSCLSNSLTSFFLVSTHILYTIQIQVLFEEG